MSFGKIFESTFTGSMVGSGASVFAVWSYVIANTRPPGLVEINPVILASMIGAGVNDIESALDYLQAADPRSRSKDCEGRRLIKVDDFLYSVPTWQKYRDSRNDEERRAYNAEAARKHRAKVKASIASSITVIDNKQQYAKAEAEAEAENTPLPPKGGEREKRDLIPTSPTALRICQLFHRRPTTKWSVKEIRAYKSIGREALAELDLVCRYTEAERAKGENGRHRRDLLTFLYNFNGELDRARSKITPQPQPQAQQHEFIDD